MAEDKKAVDETFYERADAHIALANASINENLHPGLVANSLMFSASRFNAWVTASGYQKASDLAKEKEDVLDFFTKQYRAMLSENIDAYVENFETYIGMKRKEKPKD
ncbi:hypothetical protein MNB_SV-13-818 [hydrothermal vent metagenome]|uniref:DUF3144 domain-containing protein n=1 Tax=hydrothermal vent metagenome TaxID=652676 RepID=A0A1W1D1H7_9ZZZZ